MVNKAHSCGTGQFGQDLVVLGGLQELDDPQILGPLASYESPAEGGGNKLHPFREVRATETLP